MGDLSCYLYDDREKMVEMVEDVHMSLFFVMIVYVLQVILLVMIGRYLEGNWHHYEVLARTPNQVVHNFTNAKRERRGRGRLNPYRWLIPDFFDSTVEPVRAMQYLGMRHAFVHPREKEVGSRKPLPKDFCFDHYLSYLLGELLGEMVEITPAVWVGLQLFFILLWGVASLQRWIFDLLWLCMGWITLFAAMMFAYRLKLTRRAVTPNIHAASTTVPPNLQATSSTSPSPLLAVGKSQKQALQLERRVVPGRGADVAVVLEGKSPAFLSYRPEKRSKVGQIVLGRPPNRQEMAFLADRHGVHLYVDALRFFLVLSSVHLALLAVHFGSEFIAIFGIGIGALLIALTVLPLLLLGYWCVPYMIVTLVVCSGVEMMKKEEIIARVAREAKARRVWRLLALLRYLRVRVKRKGGIGRAHASSSSSKGSVSEMTPSRREEIRDVFTLFDKDGNGEIDINELGDVLAVLGEHLDSTHVHLLLSQIDQDGSNTLDFDEFCTFIGAHEEEEEEEGEVTEEVVEYFFSLFDKDGSGKVSSGEFRATMRGVCGGAGLTEEDLDALVEDADEDDDGQVDLEEFERLLRKNLG